MVISANPSTRQDEIFAIKDLLANRLAIFT
ncbi:Uncharacterised protein [Klebsiella quasivariicola]|nr:Uncharacterised protein [Klebsiella quasivariicola]